MESSLMTGPGASEAHLSRQTIEDCWSDYGLAWRGKDVDLEVLLRQVSEFATNFPERPEIQNLIGMIERDIGIRLTGVCHP